MFHKVLLVFAIALSFSTVHAKGKKSVKNVSAKNVSLKYDHAAFLKMKKKDRVKYLSALARLAVDVEKIQNRKTAFMMLEQLLFPYADAEDFHCVNGGLAYKTASKAECSTANVPASLLTTAGNFYAHCSADESPCSLGLGVNIVNNQVRGACYKKKDHGSATRICQTALGSQGIQNLQNKLAACPSSGGSAECRSLVQTIIAHTEPLETLCAASAYKRTCDKARADVAAVRAKAMGSPGAGTDPNSPPAELSTGAGCTEVDHKVVSDAVKKASNSTNYGIDPKWLQLVSMTKGACAMGDSFDLIKQLKKFGACYSGAAPGNTSRNLRSAMAKLQNPSLGLPTPPELGHFKDNFGMDFDEYKILFCGSDSSLKFAEHVHNMKNRTNNRDDNDRNYIQWFLNQPSATLDSAMSGRPASFMVGRDNMTNVFKNYIDARRAFEAADAQHRLASAELTANPNNVTLQAAKRTADTARQSALTKMAGLNSAFQASMAQPATGAGAGGSRFKNWMGSAYETHKSAYEAANFSSSLKGGGLTNAGKTARNDFLACAEKSVTTTRNDSNQFNPIVNAKSNFDGCSRNTISGRGPNVYASGSGSYALSSLDGKSCSYSAGKIVPKSDCATTGSALVIIPGDELDLGMRGEDEICLENIDAQYAVVEMNCRAPTSPPDFDSERCGQGKVLRETYTGSGDWGCFPVSR